MTEPAVVMAQPVSASSELPSPTPATATAASFVSSSSHPPEGKKSRKPYTITKPRESWTKEEHSQFLDALKLYERDWKQIGQLIPTKSIIQIRSHAQKYFIKCSKMGLKEHIPPPRPKKRSKRPYPKSRDGGRSGRGRRGDGDEGDERSGSGSEDSDSGSSSSSSGSESEDGERESESKQQQQQQREVRVKRENGQQGEEESKQQRSPVKRGARAGSHVSSDVDEAMNGSNRGGKQERRKREASKRRTSRSRKRGSDDEQDGSGDSNASADGSTDDDSNSASTSKANKPAKRRRTTGTSSLASLPSPASFNHTLTTLPSLPLHDLPSASVYGPAWMESEATIEFDQSGGAAMQQSSSASLSDEEDGVAPLPLRLHHHSHHRSSSSSQMSHFAALSQLSPVSQLSQAADLVGEQVDDGMQLGGRVDEVGGEQSEGEVMGMYGPFPEDFVYPTAPPPPPPAPPMYGPFQPNRRLPLQSAARHMSRHRASSSSAISASSSTGNKPEFSKVYAFLGSLFDPSTSGHTEDLEAMTPSNREMVKALMHNLARNLNSSGAASVVGVGGGSSDLGEVSTVPSPMPLSFSPAPDVFTADSPAHRFTSSASAPSFFLTPATSHKPSTPPPSLSVGPSSALFTPSSALPSRSDTHISTPSDFFHPAMIASSAVSSLSPASSVASTPLPSSDGEGRGGGGSLLGLTLNLTPSGGLSTGGLDSPSGVVLFSPLGGASVGETSIGG